jgi:hypothetical protein
MSGHKIIEGLEAAARGDFSRVTIAGHVWGRDGVDKAEAWDAVIAARRDEREKCAIIAETKFAGTLTSNIGKLVADAIRTQRIARSPQESK